MTQPQDDLYAAELARKWEEACAAYAAAHEAGSAPGLTEFVAGLSTEIRPHVREELEASKPQDPPAASPEATTRFQVLRELGRGGFGRVCLAFDTLLGRHVAIKMPHADRPVDGDRVRDEARRLAGLCHPGIVPVYDVVPTADRGWWIVSAYVDGQTLSERLRQGPLAADDAVSVALRLCDALGHAHGLGMVHRDIKPSNILLDAAGWPRLLDFGLAEIEGRSQTAAVIGTPGYRPPEQETGSGGADSRSDVYSLGVVLQEMLSGRRPPAPLGLTSSLVIRELALVCRKATAERPADRYATVGDMSAALAAVRRPESASRTRPRNLVRRRMVIGGALLLGLCTVLGLGAWGSAPDPFRIRTVIDCNEPEAAIGFVLESPRLEGKPQPVWTRPREPVWLRPGDYRVVAIAGPRFHEVLRRVPRPDQVSLSVYRQARWTRRQDGVELPKVEVLPAISKEGMDLVQEPAGTSFWADRELATVGQHVAVLGRPPVGMRGSFPPGTPLTKISFDAAVHFAELVGKRLPSPAELSAAWNLAPPPRTSGFTTLWTNWFSDGRDPLGDPQVRAWTIPPQGARAVADHSGTSNFDRPSAPPYMGVRLVRSAEPSFRP